MYFIAEAEKQVLTKGRDFVLHSPTAATPAIEPTAIPAIAPDESPSFPADSVGGGAVASVAVMPVSSVCIVGDRVV